MLNSLFEHKAQTLSADVHGNITVDLSARSLLFKSIKPSLCAGTITPRGGVSKSYAPPNETQSTPGLLSENKQPSYGALATNSNVL